LRFSDFLSCDFLRQSRFRLQQWSAFMCVSLHPWLRSSIISYSWWKRLPFSSLTSPKLSGSVFIVIKVWIHTNCHKSMDPYLLSWKYGFILIVIEVWIHTYWMYYLWRVAILHLCIVSNPLPVRGILHHGNTPDHHWKWKTEKILALCFDKMWYWFQDEASAFLVILMPAVQMIVWVDSNHGLSHLFQRGQMKREAITNNFCWNYRQTYHH